jgi:integrase
MGEVMKRTKNGRFLGWYLRYYENGKRVCRPSKQPTQTEARRMLLEIEARIARGEAGIPEQPSRLTVAAFIDRFLAEYSRPRLKDPTKYAVFARSKLQPLRRLLGKQPVDLDRQAMLRLRATLSAKYAANTVRTNMAQVSTLYSWGQRQGLCKSNPVKGLDMPARENAIDYLSAEEVATLIRLVADRAANGCVDRRLDQLRVLFALHTGLRKGELCGLRWRDLDLKSGRLTIARSYRTTPKSGKPRHLRLPDALVPLLHAWQPSCPATPDGLVMPVRLQHRKGWGIPNDSSSTMGLPTLLAKIGCRPSSRPWHLLRHTFASHFMMAGGSLLTLSKILGHADIKITMVYAHLAPDFIGQEMNRVKF